MADEKKDEKKKDKGEGGKGGLLDNKIVLLGIIVVLQAVMAVGIIQFVIGPKLNSLAQIAAEPAAVASPDPVEGEGVLVGLDDMTVTLKGQGRRQSYLKIAIDLEVADQPTADQVTSRMPQLRDIAILALSSKSSEDLASVDGKAALKAELHRKFSDVLPDGKLTSVYFSDMVVQ
ncbi:flagellar basal body-associated FliL family protein [bacterium]|nr:flagellar basal body-associated FliL family protein [bacterium]HPF33945.1 flagellar basal body-associated FliL family protein [Candidatus Krumholzibacteria bacterium]HRX50923.1 flagellar basal body-associated FliL family protein [Candidatus Krumholzibacteria bacterium]